LGLTRQFLHAHCLGFDNLNGKRIDVISSLPPELQEVLDRLRSQHGPAASLASTSDDQPWWLNEP
jgi:hypothetical protein